MAEEGRRQHNMALFKRGNIWWYEFLFARRRIRESAKTTSKTVAKLAEQKRRRQLEDGFNGVEDDREERIRSIKELGQAYLGRLQATAQIRRVCRLCRGQRHPSPECDHGR